MRKIINILLVVMSAVALSGCFSLFGTDLEKALKLTFSTADKIQTMKEDERAAEYELELARLKAQLSSQPTAPADITKGSTKLKRENGYNHGQRNNNRTHCYWRGFHREGPAKVYYNGHLVMEVNDMKVRQEYSSGAIWKPVSEWYGGPCAIGDSGVTYKTCWIDYE